MANKAQMGIGAVIIVLIAAYFGVDLQKQPVQDLKLQNQILVEKERSQTHEDSKSENLPLDNDDAKIQQAFQTQKSDIQVRSSGIVKAVLADDNNGSRHQKFILQLQNGLTVLVAHNIDLSPRINGLQKGDALEFYGEYEYSEKGGVIHWTHHDPQQRHTDGWLKYKGRTYQ